MRDAKHKTQPSRSSLRLLVIFCLVVLVAIFASLGYRLFTLIQGSKFDGHHSFLVAFSYKNEVDVVSVNPSQKSFNHLQIRGGKTSKDDLKESEVLPDSEILLTNRFNLNDISDYFFKAAWHKGGLTTKLNLYDLYRLGLLTKNISKDSITSESIHVPIDQSTSSTMLQQLFIDDAIDQENKTVSIINGTGIPGLGTRLEQPLTTMGMSVISVTNSDSVKSSSKITYVGEKSYTVKRLSSLLELPAEQTVTQGISDIIILIGKDKSQTDRF